jgi:comEA protein
MFRSIINRLALTSTEQKVLLFLAGTLVVGTVVRYTRDATASNTQFDYRSVDSSFARFRQKVADASSQDRVPQKNALINVNTASLEELVLIPGIGSTLAARILERREKEGAFRTLDELRSVKGISIRKFEKIKPFVSVH